MSATSQIQITAMTAVSALGYGLDALTTALIEERSGLRPCDFEDCNLSTYIGRIPKLEAIELEQEWNSRNNKIAYATLQQDNFYREVERCRDRYGAKRVAVILGTSTSGFSELEHAYRDNKGQLPADFSYDKQVDLFASTRFISNYFHLKGPSFTINTACSSSAKAFISAARLLNSEFCDAVLVAGVDSLCLNTLYGFNSLELLDTERCRPCDRDRQGLSIGEAGAMVLLERGIGALALAGYGESSDAHHMSAPHPEGLGSVLAMRNALSSAKISPEHINYINMHGTASRLNDAAEDSAIYAVFADQVPASSTKGWMGHTLGAAGALEFVICCLLFTLELYPGCLNTTLIDPIFRSKILLKNKKQKSQYILTNSCGFGGNNCSLILGKNT